MAVPSAVPTFVAIAAAIVGVLLAPRALDAPPPVVREPVVREVPGPPDDLTPRPVLAVSRGTSWKLDVTDDGVAAYVHRSWKEREDVRLEGPIDPALVPRLRALRRRAGLVSLASMPSCLRGPNHTAADDYMSTAARDVHAEGAELANAIHDEMYRRHIFIDRVQTDGVLIVVARRVGHRPPLGSTFEVVEVLRVGRGGRAPAIGERFPVEEHTTPGPVGETSVATRGTHGWFLEGRTPEDTRRTLAWLAAHPPTKRRFDFDAATDTGPAPPL